MDTGTGRDDAERGGGGGARASRRRLVVTSLIAAMAGAAIAARRTQHRPAPPPASTPPPTARPAVAPAAPGRLGRMDDAPPAPDPAEDATPDAPPAELASPPRRSGRLRRALLVASALLLLAAGGLVAWDSLRPPPAVETVGEVPEPAPPVPAPAPEPAPPPEPEPVGPTSPPVSITVASIGVDAAVVVPVGLQDDGAMEIPEDVATIGWYDPRTILPGVVPGATGTAVLSGHVDSRSQGRGAFYDLRLLEVGDEVDITHADGTVTRFVVTGRTSYGKSEIPLADIFVWDGPPRLALITCGGEFDRTARSYEDNIVVLAVPA